MKKIMMIIACTVALAGNVFAANNDHKEIEKVLMLFPSDQVEDNEYTITRKALEKAGFHVTAANSSGKKAAGMHGGSFKPQLSIAQVKAADFDMLVTIGGNGIFGDLENQAYINVVKEFADAKKLTTGICGSTAIMAKSGAFKGLKATTFAYDPLVEVLKKNGAQYVDQPVVVSGHIITGNGPKASQDFASAIVKAAKAY